MAPERFLSARLSDMVAVTEHPSLDIVAAGKRLRYAISLTRGAPSAFWALLHLEGEWQNTCRDDFEWLIKFGSRKWPPFVEENWPEW